MTKCALFGERYGEQQLDDLLRLHEKIVENAHLMGKLLDFARKLSVSRTFYVIPSLRGNDHYCVVNVSIYSVRMTLNDMHGRCTLSVSPSERTSEPVFETNGFGIRHVGLTIDDRMQQVLGDSNSSVKEVLDRLLAELERRHEDRSRQPAPANPA